VVEERSFLLPDEETLCSRFRDRPLLRAYRFSSRGIEKRKDPLGFFAIKNAQKIAVKFGVVSKGR
jgi:hypothetical protein